MRDDPGSGEPATDSEAAERRAAAPPLLRAVMEIFGISRGMSLVVLLLLIGLTSIAIFFFVRSAPPRTIVITTGPEASMFHTNAWKYAAILASNDVTLKVLTSHGSLENLN